MYLKRLELHGFKSFAHRTTLDFDAGVTCIVGPNGCGKSNIVDAVRWVVGEQRARALRSEKMENVIFNGTSRRKALGMAEVLLTVENTRGVLPTEYAEVTLGRRLYRSGESEYLLNGVECRLRDIQDLFMDTGMGAGAYSVIELAMVEEILSESADDRRRLFEEAAGITKYKLRRRQALGRLEGTQHDLTRLRDLTEEIGTNVRSLKRQADRAAQFQALDERRAWLEKTLLYADHARLDAERGALEAEQQRLADALEAQAAQVATREAALERLSADRIACEADRRAAQEALHAHLAELRGLEGEVRLARERLTRLEAERQRLHAELQEGEARQRAQGHVQARFEDEKERAAPRHESARLALDAVAAERGAAQESLDAARHAVQAARRDEAAAERVAAEARRALDRLQARAEMQAAEAERLRTLPGSAASESLAPAEAARAEAEKALHHAGAAVERAEADRTQLESSRRALAERRRALESRLSALDAEQRLLHGLVASYEGFSSAVQTLARHTPDLLTVADVLRADAPWQDALAAALGDWAGCIVVQDEAAADMALALLREQQAGQVLLLVLDRLEAPASLAPGGATPLAAHVAPVSEAYEGLRDLLLHGWFVADSLEEARREASAGRSFVTPEGAWADGRGALRGGSAAQTGTSPSRAVQRERLVALEAEAAALRVDLAALIAQERQAAGALEAVDFGALRNRQAEAARLLRQHENALARLQADAAARQRQTRERVERRAALEAEQQRLEEQAGEAQEVTAAAEAELRARREAREEAETSADALERESRGVFERYNEAALAEVEARNRLDTLRSDLDRTARTLADMARQQTARATRYDEAGRERDAAREAERQAAETLDARAAARQPLEDAAARAETAVLDLQAALSEGERVLREARGRRDALVREAGEKAVRRAEVQTRLETLAEDFARLFDAPIAAERHEIPADFEPAAAREEVQALRRRIASLGSINALALEAYQTEKSRFDFLTAQQQDLEHAEASLLSTIEEINTTAAQRFQETFTQIETSFVALFRELFGEDARAELRLANPSDPLESAVDIFAQPGGKRPSALSQLSGGEKTLTAIALLFSIYLVKPSPFCILDEVDAPLDEVNVERFMRLIHRFADRTQFILVTHNKRTMERADRLYGVTMQEPGVSKTVTVRFEEAAADEA